MVSAPSRLVVLMLVLLALAGCDAAERDDDLVHDAAVEPVDDGFGAGNTRADAGSFVPLAPLDGGSGVVRMHDAGMSVDGGSPACGDVAAANHPPFAAIRKLATTRDEVRVLVYGQSISEQSWWRKTKEWLQRTYPSGNLVMEQHAHGGCPAECLIGSAPWVHDGSQRNRLPEDVFAFRPDLVIFHVFGSDHDYKQIMKALRTGCAAFDDYRTADGKEQPLVKCTPEQRALSAGYRAPEVLVQNDFTNEAKLLKPCPASVTSQNWDCYMNEQVIPQQIALYGYTLQDNFHLWPKYIAENGVKLETLIADDGVHLREPGGTELMFRMTVPHLCFVPKTDPLGRAVAHPLRAPTQASRRRSATKLR